MTHRFLNPIAPAVLALLAASAPALALDTQHNVSQIVLGVEEPMPIGPVAMPPCTSCRYLGASGVQINNGYAAWPGAYTMANWPLPWVDTPPYHTAVIDDLAVPAAPPGTQYDTLPGGAVQRARVAYNFLPQAAAEYRRLDVQTWRSGTGASAVSYAVRIEAPAGPARRTFLRFAVPQPLRDGKTASFVGGPSGNQPFTVWPKRMQARTAVDVYVDGLPVWSSERLHLLPQRYASTGLGPFELQFGQPLEPGTATLFLGSLPPGSARTAVIVMRADLRVDQSTCHTVNNPLGDDSRRCDTRLEGLTLPSRSGPPHYLHTPDILVYSL